MTQKKQQNKGQGERKKECFRCNAPMDPPYSLVKSKRLALEAKGVEPPWGPRESEAPMYQGMNLKDALNASVEEHRAWVVRFYAAQESDPVQATGGVAADAVLASRGSGAGSGGRAQKEGKGGLCKTQKRESREMVLLHIAVPLGGAVSFLTAL